MKNQVVNLTQGTISYCDSGSNKPAIIFLHGLGAAKEVFHRQYDSALASSNRLIGIDLAGHGNSDKPQDPKAQYTVQGLATTVTEVLNALSVERAVLVGWSLGGHVAIEMMNMAPERVYGVMLTGTPPLDHGTFAAFRGYQMRMDLLIALKETMSAREADRFARLCYGEAFDDAKLAWVMRTDMHIRPIFNRSITQGSGPSQKAIVEGSLVPLCIANGERDPIIRGEFFESLKYANLWEGHTHILQDCGHVPFLTAPNRFNILAQRFAADVVMRGRTPKIAGEQRRSA